MQEKVNKKLPKAVWEKLFDEIDELQEIVKEKLRKEKKNAIKSSQI